MNTFFIKKSSLLIIIIGSLISTQIIANKEMTIEDHEHLFKGSTVTPIKSETTDKETTVTITFNRSQDDSSEPSDHRPTTASLFEALLHYHSLTVQMDISIKKKQHSIRRVLITSPRRENNSYTFDSEQDYFLDTTLKHSGKYLLAAVYHHLMFMPKDDDPIKKVVDFIKTDPLLKTQCVAGYCQLPSPALVADCNCDFDMMIDITKNKVCVSASTPPIKKGKRRHQDLCENLSLISPPRKKPKQKAPISKEKKIITDYYRKELFHKEQILSVFEQFITEVDQHNATLPKHRVYYQELLIGPYTQNENPSKKLHVLLDYYRWLQYRLKKAYRLKYTGPKSKRADDELWDIIKNYPLDDPIEHDYLHILLSRLFNGEIINHPDYPRYASLLFCWFHLTHHAFIDNDLGINIEDWLKTYHTSLPERCHNITTQLEITTESYHQAKERLSVQEHANLGHLLAHYEGMKTQPEEDLLYDQQKDIPMSGATLWAAIKNFQQTLNELSLTYRQRLSPLSPETFATHLCDTHSIKEVFLAHDIEITFRLALFSPPETLGDWREPVHLLLQRICLDFELTFVDDNQSPISFYEWIGYLGKAATDYYQTRESRSDDIPIPSQDTPPHPKKMKECSVLLKRVKITLPNTPTAEPEQQIDKKPDTSVQDPCISRSDDPSTSSIPPESMDFSQLLPPDCH